MNLGKQLGLFGLIGIQLGLVMMVTSACTAEDKLESDLSYKVHTDSHGMRFEGVFDDEIEVCVQGPDAALRHKTSARRALQTWIGAIQDLDSRIGNPEITFRCGHLSDAETHDYYTDSTIKDFRYSLEAPYTVWVDRRINRAHARYSGKVFIHPDDDYGVQLHEFGHAFVGLKDTYIEGAGGTCQIGEDPSVMCSHYDFGTDIYAGEKDDYHGARRSFRDFPPQENSMYACIKNYRHRLFLPDNRNAFIALRDGCMTPPDELFATETYQIKWKEFPGGKKIPVARDANGKSWGASLFIGDITAHVGYEIEVQYIAGRYAGFRRLGQTEETEESSSSEETTENVEGSGELEETDGIKLSPFYFEEDREWCQLPYVTCWTEDETSLQAQLFKQLRGPYDRHSPSTAKRTLEIVKAITSKDPIPGKWRFGSLSKLAESDSDSPVRFKVAYSIRRARFCFERRRGEDEKPEYACYLKPDYKFGALAYPESPNPNTGVLEETDHPECISMTNGEDGSSFGAGVEIELDITAPNGRISCSRLTGSVCGCDEAYVQIQGKRVSLLTDHEPIRFLESRQYKTSHPNYSCSHNIEILSKNTLRLGFSGGASCRNASPLVLQCMGSSCYYKFSRATAKSARIIKIQEEDGSYIYHKDLHKTEDEVLKAKFR